MSQLRTIPWLTEGAIRFLEGYLRPEMRVLEFGMGGSTIWMVPRCKLISVEHDEEWARQVTERITEAIHWKSYILARPYDIICDSFDNDSFGLVLIDGRDRMACLRAAKRIIKPGGYVMLDNAERRHYWKVYRSLMKTWIEATDVQSQPDSLGFTYEGWTTTWWQKPQENTGEDN